MNAEQVKLQYLDDIRRVSVNLSSGVNGVISTARQYFHELPAEDSSIRVAVDMVDKLSVCVSDQQLTDTVSKAKEERAGKLVKIILCGSEEKVEEWEIIEDDDQQQQEVIRHEEGQQGEAIKRESSVEVKQEGINATHPNWMTVAVSEESKHQDGNGDAKVDKETAKTAPEEKQFVVEGAVVHSHVLCSMCGQTIRGTRWKCFYCVSPVLNLCDTCLPKDSHNPLHPFVRILTPEQCPDTGALSSGFAAYQLVTSLGTDAKDSVEPGETFFAGWRLKNGSDKPWSKNLQIRRWGGRVLDCDSLNVVSVAPGEEIDLLLELRVPTKTKAKEGKARSLFRIFDGNDIVGPPLVVEFTVDKIGRLAKKEAPKTPFQEELAVLHSMGFKDRARLTKLFQEGKKFDAIVELMIAESTNSK